MLGLSIFHDILRSKTSSFLQNDFVRCISEDDQWETRLFINGSEDIDAISAEKFKLLGSAVAVNTKLKILFLSVPKSEGDKSKWRMSLSLVGQNRSISSFHYSSTPEIQRSLRVESLLELRDFLQKNDALKDVNLVDLDREEMETIATLLTLRRYPLDGLHTNSVEFLMVFFEQNPKAIPKRIGLSDMIGDVAKEIAEFLRETREVDFVFDLNLCNCYLGPQGLQRIAKAIAERENPLGGLQMCFADEPALAEFAAEFNNKPNSIPSKLDLRWCLMCVTGGNLLGEILMKRSSPVEELDIMGEDKDIGLLQALRVNPAKAPKKLSVDYFESPCSDHIEVILRNPHCSIETLCVTRALGGDVNPIDFGNLLVSICCDPTSINATILSNHTLSSLHFRDFVSPILDRYFEMNKNPDKKKVARMKVYEAHFARKFNVDFFEDMPPSLLAKFLQIFDQANAECDKIAPGAQTVSMLRRKKRRRMEWMVDDEEAKENNLAFNSLSIHYMMVKNIPSLFDTLLVERH